MMLGKTTLCLVALCLGTAAAQEDEKKLVTEGGVVVLNSKNFDTALKLYDVMLVEFYAPWCGFCKQLKPEYEASALELATEDYPITLAKCDVIKEEKVGERFKVESFPTLKVFLKHEPKAIKWEGNPDKKNVLEKMRAYRKETPFEPPLKDIADVASATSFAKGFANVLGLFTSSDDPEYKAFAKASVFQAHREFVKFGVTTSADIAQHFGVEAPAVLVLKQFDDAQEAAPADVLADTKALEKWVQSTTRPLVCPLIDSKTDCGMLSPMFTIFVPTATVDKGAEYLDFKKVAKDSRAAGHDLHFGFMGAEQQATEKFFELFPEEMPTVAGLVRGGMFKGGAVKFHVDKNEWEDMTYDSMTQIRDLFIKSAEFDHANGLEPSLASNDPEEIPEGSSLKSLVSTEWNSMVMQQDKKDVLVEFYAPWCSMCKVCAAPTHVCLPSCWHNPACQLTHRSSRLILSRAPLNQPTFSPSRRSTRSWPTSSPTYLPCSSRSSTRRVTKFTRRMCALRATPLFSSSRRRRRRSKCSTSGPTRMSYVNPSRPR